LNVTTGGAITDSGNLVVTGTTTLAAGAGNDITLDNANNFSTVSITSGRNVTLNDTNALILGASTVSGTLAVTTAGAITQSGALNVTGTATLAAGSGNDITLNNPTNDFSTVGITSGRNITLVDTNALDLGASTVSGNLALTTGGAVAQSGALNVAGITTLTASAANTDILLDTQANNFASPLSFGGALTNFRDIGLRNTNAGATVPTLSGLTNLRDLTLTFDSAPVNLPALTASGTLNVTAGGAITDSGNVVVTRVTTLTAGAANDIVLDSAGNNFSTVAVNSGNNVTLRDANALDLGTSNVSGNLSVTTGGAITDSGNLVVAGLTTLAAGAGNDITLDSAGNNFSSVGVTSGRNVTLADTNALDLDTSTVSGTLNVTTGGTLTQSGALNVTGATTLSAGTANDITLDNVSNDFSTVAINSGNNVTLADANVLDLGTSTVSGMLNVTTNGSLTQSGALTVAGTATLAAGSGNDIALTNAANDFSTVAVISGRDVALTDTNALDLGASTISGTLDVSTGGAVTQSGALNVAGNATFSAGANNDITFDNAANDFTTLAITSGRNVSFRDTNDISLGTSQISGDFTLSAAGAIVDGDGAGINISANSANLAAANVGSAANPLETAVGTLNATANAGGVYVAEADGVTVNNVVAHGGNVAISNTTGDMVINTITATGGIDLVATGGSILDGNGAANNLIAGADSTLQALGGVIGLSADPIEVNINSGALGVAATGQVGGVSVDITGTVLPSGTLTLLNSPPGEVIFNSAVLHPTSINLPDITGIAAELNPQRVNEEDIFTKLLLDVIGEDFFKAKPLHCTLDAGLETRFSSGPCRKDDH
jgi:hypothetical protein